MLQSDPNDPAGCKAKAAMTNATSSSSAANDMGTNPNHHRRRALRYYCLKPMPVKLALLLLLLFAGKPAFAQTYTFTIPNGDTISAVIHGRDVAIVGVGPMPVTGYGRVYNYIVNDAVTTLTVVGSLTYFGGTIPLNCAISVVNQRPTFLGQCGPS